MRASGSCSPAANAQLGRLPVDVLALVLVLLDRESLVALALAGRDAYAAARAAFLRQSTLRLEGLTCAEASPELLRAVRAITLRWQPSDLSALADLAVPMSVVALRVRHASAATTSLGRRRRSSPQAACTSNDWRELAHLLPHLVEIDLRAVTVDDVEWLAALPRLEKLALNGAQLDDKLAPLGELRNLRALTLRDYFGADLSVLAKLPQLAELWLGDCPRVADLSPITSCLHHLRVLKLTDVEAGEQLLRGGLAKLPALQELEIKSIGLSHKQIELPPPDAYDATDAAWPRLPLAKLTLWNLRLPHLAFLALCPSLQHFEFCADLSPLDALTQLAHLDLHSHQRGVVRLALLPALPRLKALHVPELDDCNALCKRQCALSALIVRRCTQADVRCAPELSTLPALRKLSLMMAPPSQEPQQAAPLDLQPLRSLSTHLHELRIVHAEIADLRPLGFLYKLERLDLSVDLLQRPLSHKIADFSPLARLSNLQLLALNGRSEFQDADLELLKRS
ncbi:hypothetical protein PybrP1_011636, partial [[Pythium] brassicae (nom. inval.)]